eukprot:TRINITY_DN2478_c0_g1_i1.p1 TRINITY_DN2478_c0_g1~~TRINITY_DN2478_c0_g1_i1.p1  ORF type:complete len:733 (+),score=150.04 TRINITY_DN2478_c0_g1_i1:61-2199(+)
MEAQSMTIDVIPLVLVQNESINWEKSLPADAEDALLSHWTHLYKEGSESGGWNFLEKFIELVKHHYPRAKSHGMERCIVHFWLFRVDSSDFRPLSRRILEHWKLLPLSFLHGDPPFRHFFTFLCQGCKSIPGFGETRLRPLLEEMTSMNQFFSTSERLGMEIGVSVVKLKEIIGHYETAEMVVETLRHRPFVFLFWMLLTVGYIVAHDVVTEYLVSSFTNSHQQSRIMGELSALLLFEGNEYLMCARKWMGMSLKRLFQEIDGISAFYEERLVMEYVIQVTTMVLQRRSDEFESSDFRNDRFGIPFLLTLSIGVKQKDVLESMAPICLELWQSDSEISHSSMNICDLGSSISLLKEHGEELGFPSHYLQFSDHLGVNMRESKISIAKRFELWGAYVSICHEARKWEENHSCCEEMQDILVERAGNEKGIDVEIESGEESIDGSDGEYLDEGEVDESDHDGGMSNAIAKHGRPVPANTLLSYCLKHWPWELPSNHDILCKWIIEILLMYNSISGQPVDGTILKEWWMGLLTLDGSGGIDGEDGSRHVEKILTYLVERKDCVIMTTWNAVFESFYGICTTSAATVHLWRMVDHLSFVLPSDPAMFHWYDVVLKTAIGCGDDLDHESSSPVNNISRWLVQKVISTLLQVSDTDLPHYQAVARNLMGDSLHMRTNFRRVIEGKAEEYIHRIAYGVTPSPTKERMESIRGFITLNCD